MDLLEATKVCFSKFAVFTGRARRSEYWYFALFQMLVLAALTIIETPSKATTLSDLGSLVFLLPSIAVTIRRMHDVNRSGWFCLIPVYGFILAVTEGDRGENRFGPATKTFI